MWIVQCSQYDHMVMSNSRLIRRQFFQRKLTTNGSRKQLERYFPHLCLDHTAVKKAFWLTKLTITKPLFHKNNTRPDLGQMYVSVYFKILHRNVKQRPSGLEWIQKISNPIVLYRMWPFAYFPFVIAICSYGEQNCNCENITLRPTYKN